MTNSRRSDDVWSRISDLEKENARLKEINKALVERVKLGEDRHGAAHSLYQAAILLHRQVDDDAENFGNALSELGGINRERCSTNEDAEIARSRLVEAMEAMSEGFVLCDPNDRLVMCNRKYRELWPELADIIKPGVPFTALLHRAHSLGLFANDDDVSGTPGAISLRQRLLYHLRPEGLLVVKVKSGRWLQINERRTRDGGSVAIYTDITAIKVSEQRQRERELAAKNTALRAIFHNISQGILVVDSERRVVAWNDRLLEILDMSPDELAPGDSIHALRNVKAIRSLFGHFGFGREPIQCGPFCMEEIGNDGRVLEIRLGPMPGGGIVSTFTDITERKRWEWALRDSERRIRVITDALPALIAYVDADQRYCFINKPYEDWFGRARSEIAGHKMSEVLGSQYEICRPYVEMVLKGQQGTFEIDLSTARKKNCVALVHYLPHFASDGTILGFFAMTQDISERKEVARQLQEAKENLEQRVVERTKELIWLNLQLKQEVDERRQAEEALKAAKAEADQANMSKTKFLAAASHDLLQPLNAARVFAAALGEARMPERHRDLVTKLSIALNAVDELLSALLDISKFDAGVHKPEIADFRLEQILKLLFDEHVPQAQARQLSLNWIPCSAVVRTDPTLVGRVLRNFLSNAMRYTRAGRILMGCRRRADGIEVQVWDTGIGIPQDKLTTVFEEFQRLNHGGEGNDRGMGLGLAIVERITRTLGHPLIVRSRLGTGSMFGVLLPYGDATEVNPRISAFASPVMADRLAAIRVMVIENDPDELEGMTTLLRSWSCEVCGAEDLDAALPYLRGSSKPPQVIVADYQLDNGHTGLQAVAVIRAIYRNAIPGIIITADRADQVHDAVHSAGLHLLKKPLKPARLRSLLAHLTMRH